MLGNSKKYIFELVAIFLGISLSFYAENYRQDIEIHNLLKDDLLSINADISNDINEMERIDKRIKISIIAIDSLRLYLTDKIDVDQTIMDRLIKRMLYSRNTFFPYGAAYQVAQNSGRINAIIDQDLMKLLSEYYQNNYERVRINNLLHDDAITKPLALFYPKLMVRKEFSNDRELNEMVLKKKEFLDLLITIQYSAEIYTNYIIKNTLITAQDLKTRVEAYLISEYD